METINSLIGKEVQIYPGDTYRKTGVIQEITPMGFLFKITSYNGNDKQYQVGKLHFIGIGSKLSFQEL